MITAEDDSSFRVHELSEIFFIPTCYVCDWGGRLTIRKPVSKPQSLIRLFGFQLCLVPCQSFLFFFFFPQTADSSPDPAFSSTTDHLPRDRPVFARASGVLF